MCSHRAAILEPRSTVRPRWGDDAVPAEDVVSLAAAELVVATGAGHQIVSWATREDVAGISAAERRGQRRRDRDPVLPASARGRQRLEPGRLTNNRVLVGRWIEVKARSEAVCGHADVIADALHDEPIVLVDPPLADLHVDRPGWLVLVVEHERAAVQEDEAGLCLSRAEAQQAEAQRDGRYHGR